MVIFKLPRLSGTVDYKATKFFGEQKLSLAEKINILLMRSDLVDY